MRSLRGVCRRNDQKEENLNFHKLACSFTAVGAALSFQAAHAQSNNITIPGDLCGRLASESAQPLVGKWLAVNRDGAGNVGPFGFALKSRPTENLALEESSRGGLVFTGKNDLGNQRLDMAPLAGGEALPDTFNVRLPNGRISEVNVARLLPCAWSTMPGYKGHIDYPLQGAGQMRMTVMLNFPSQSIGFGLLHFTGNMSGHRIDVWRYVTLTRIGGKGKGAGLGCNPLDPVCRKALACQKDKDGNVREPKVCEENDEDKQD